MGINKARTFDSFGYEACDFSWGKPSQLWNIAMVDREFQDNKGKFPCADDPSKHCTMKPPE